MYSSLGHMVDNSDFICGTYSEIRLLYMSIKYMACLAYVCGLFDIFVSGTYVALICGLNRLLQ